MTHALYAGLMIWIQLISTWMDGWWISIMSQVFSRCGSEPLLTFNLHQGFIDAASEPSKLLRHVSLF